ncbi:uncharacterized protein LOC123396011 [Hordeum vulgare subsp. vulgare]|uniref:Predicted protein n=1 Tax=Hordeum vulgare subsp. vulgare TaxID=112509 RepID=F2EIV6_HORVV|nr:uncharacterized protein LOC123396011 [Hordeum vulgare subsp. vulgare]BAK07278.1 predicted protein [Hordeum vulgare subsp. vulgare]
MLPLVNKMQATPEREMSRQQQMMTKVSISILVMALPVLYVSVLRVPPATLFRDTTFWFLMSNSIIVVIAADSGMLFFGSSASASLGSVDDRPFVVSNYNGDAAAVPMVSVSSDEPLLPVVVIDDQPLVVAKDVVVYGDTAVDSHAHALVVRGDEDVRPKMAMPSTPSSAYATGDCEGDDDGVTVKARLTASRSLAREERAARRRRSRSHSHALVPDTVVQDKSVVVVRDEKLRRTATEGRRRPTAAEEEESEYYARLSDEELNRRVEDFITRFNREIRLQVEKEDLQQA